MNILQLHILAQAIVDAIDFELERFKVDISDEEYEEILEYILKYPSIRRRWNNGASFKQRWKEEINEARGWYD